MKAMLFMLVAVLGLMAGARADDEKVHTLTSANFDEFIKNQPLSLIEFYAPWCGHCKQLAPEYEKAAQALEGKNGGVLAKVDCTVEKDVCNKFDVQGFPTVKLFRNDGSEPTDYDQARKADAIVKFMIKQNAPSVTELADAAAVNAFASTESVKAVIFLSSSDSIESYTKVANALRNEYFFGAVKDNAAANAEFKVTTTPSVVLFRNFDEGNVQLTGPQTSEAITAFIKANSFPLIGTIGPENYAKYLERGFNLVWIFVESESEDHKAILKNELTPVAAEFRDKLSFVQLDGVKWVEHAKSFGLSGSLPGSVIEDRDKRKNYLYPEGQAFTKDGFRAFVDGVLKGTIAPNVKSDPVPEDNSGPVKIVVGTTFDELVINNDKDVLVEFYAPWCGHCKSLAPKFEELGKSFASDDTVVIAKLDATTNDSPADIQGFPTLILYPAGDKSNPIPYEGDRTIKAMANFINQNGKAGGRPKPVEAGDDAADDHEGHDHGDHDGHDHAHDDEL